MWADHKDLLYGERTNIADLTQEQKENISNLAQIASGLAVAAGGGSISDIGTSVAGSKNAVENNSLAGDYIRDEHKGSVEYWKDKVRETVGENTISQITNGVLIAYGDAFDITAGVADTLLDAVLALSSCTMGTNYCDTAMKDLKGANQTVYNALDAINSGQALDSLVNTVTKAQQGDQKALEEVAGILTSMLAPSKIITGNAGKTGNIVNKVDDFAGKGTSVADDIAGAVSKDKIPGPTANWNNYTHAEAVIKTENSEKLVNADKAVIDSNKVTSYALNTEHPVGGNKAKVFESALGYNQTNANELISKIQAGAKTNTAVLGKADNYGQRITIDMPITGANGKTAIVRTGWIYDPGSSIPRLTTLYVK